MATAWGAYVIQRAARRYSLRSGKEFSSVMSYMEGKCAPTANVPSDPRKGVRA